MPGTDSPPPTIAVAEELLRLVPGCPWLAQVGPNDAGLAGATAVRQVANEPPPMGCSPPPGWHMQRPAADDGAAKCRPPPMRVRTQQQGRGRCVVATRDIAAGELILIEQSLVVAPVDAAVFAQAGGFAASPAGHGALCERERRAVAAAAALVSAVVSGSATGYALAQAAAPQWVGALVLAIINTNSCNGAGASSVLGRVGADWVGTASGNEPAWTAFDGTAAATALTPDQRKRAAITLQTARRILEPLRPYLAAGDTASQPGKNALADAAAALAQCDLLTAPRLAAWLDAAACNGVEAHVPGVADRVGLFPFLRYMEHECRPACAVSFLDSPLSHGWLPHAAASHVQRSDPVYGSLVRPIAPPAPKKGAAGKSAPEASTRSLIDGPPAALPSHALLRPSVAVVSALRSVKAGEPLSISYLPSAWMPRSERRAELAKRYFFDCNCRWCDPDAPDVARAFRCPECPRGSGAVCPRGDGSAQRRWECVQCGHHPEPELVDKMCDRERQLARVKADKAAGMAKLIDDEFVHFSHALVLRKLDEWAEVAWRAQDAPLCINILETLVKCCDRVGVGEDDAVLLAMAAEGKGNAAATMREATSGREARRAQGREAGEQPDTTKAQYLEFLGKVHHALGNAHTSRDAYHRAYLARVACGQRLSWWCRVTRYMAEDKTLADLMDSK